jgi:Zn-dependent protease with chaperone function
VSHIFFVDPNKSALDSLYATHPPMEERIRRLREM